LARILAREKAETFLSSELFSLNVDASTVLETSILEFFGISTVAESSISGRISATISIISGEATANSNTLP
jgi:hypothetical protein